MILKCMWRTSSQDGGTGKYTLPPHTTKRTTRNFKTKNNQNCWKVKLYGSLKTKELKKKYSSRPVGGVEMGSLDREDSWQVGSWQSGWSHICMWVNQEEQLWSETDCTTQGSSAGNKDSKPLTVKPCGGCSDGRNS